MKIINSIKKMKIRHLIYRYVSGDASGDAFAYICRFICRTVIWSFFVVCGCSLCGCTKEEGLVVVSKEEAYIAENRADVGKQAGNSVQETEPKAETAETMETTETVEKMPDASIIVYICGAVPVPGVYEMRADARIYEVVECAGGLLPEADSTIVNLSLGLTDEQMIYIPYFGENMDAGSNNDNGDDNVKSSGNASDDKIDINSATAQELCKLPGIGEAKAKAIVAYREKHGAFSKISDIKKVSGIKEALYESLKDYIVAGKGK